MGRRMIIPEGMTEEELMDTMSRVINRMAKRYTFYGYTENDIKQESYIICISALERYDSKRPLENFLAVNLSNRLKNFVRDNHFVKSVDETSNEDKIKISQPAQLENELEIVDSKEKYAVSDEDIDISQLSYIIDCLLPANVRMDYLRVLNGGNITKARKEEVYACIKEIIGDSYEEG